MEQVILVDKDDVECGFMEKMHAHRTGKLHRAFSIFLFNPAGQLLLQQRALGKYHCAGLWTNTCCSHPRPGEAVAHAAVRRLDEEMGLSCKLTRRFSFKYRAALDNGLTEHELVHVFTGVFKGAVVPNPDEVQAFRYIDVDYFSAELESSPDQFTPWLQIIWKDHRPSVLLA